MKRKYKLKTWVIIGVYFISIGAIIASLFLVGKILKASIYSEDDQSYVFHGLIDESVPVISYSNETIIKPYEEESIEILKHYYDKDTDAKLQEKSLLLYEKTYMQNTGIIYSNGTAFDVLCVLDGTVENIVADEIMGNIVTIRHSNKLLTIYQSLNEVKVLIGDIIRQGDVIGTSGVNKIITESENILLFEVIHNGNNINPEDFYKMKQEDLS